MDHHATEEIGDDIPRGEADHQPTEATHGQNARHRHAQDLQPDQYQRDDQDGTDDLGQGRCRGGIHRLGMAVARRKDQALLQPSEKPDAAPGDQEQRNQCPDPGQHDVQPLDLEMVADHAEADHQRGDPDPPA